MVATMHAVVLYIKLNSVHGVTCIALYSITAEVSLMANTALCTLQYVRKPGLESDTDFLNKHEQRSGSSSFTKHSPVVVPPASSCPPW